jgi:Holliday junction resolvase
MINAKKKGNAGEHAFSHWLQSKGFRAFRNAMSGGSVWKGDIANDLDMTIEVKTCKKINLMECWRQVDRDSSIAHNQPILAVRFDNMPKDSWLIVQHSEDWAALLQEKKALEERILYKP